MSAATSFPASYPLTKTLAAIQERIHIAHSMRSAAADAASEYTANHKPLNFRSAPQREGTHMREDGVNFGRELHDAF